VTGARRALTTYSLIVDGGKLMDRSAPHAGVLLVAAATAVLIAVCPVRAEDDSASAAARAYLSANGLLNRGLYELAAEEYRKFLADHADHEKAPVARYGLAVCCFRTGKYDEALGELEPLAERDGFEYAAEVWAMLGQCWLAKKDYAGAAEAFARVVGKHRDHALADDAAAMWAEALYLAGEHAEAVKRCEAFVARWPDSPLRERVDYFWGLARMALRDHASAAELFEGLATRSPDGPFADHASLLTAQCHHRNKALDQAGRWYQRVLDGSGSRPRAADPSPYLPDALLGLATLRHSQGRSEEAGKLLDRLLEQSPDSPLSASAKLERGRVWFDQQRYKEALELFTQVGDQGGELADAAAYWSAKCRLRQEDFSEAAGVLTAALKQHPDSDLRPEMEYDRIVALTRLEDYAAATSAIESFRKRYPKHALAADALHLAAAVAHQQHRFEESQKHCREFLEQYPEHALTAEIGFLSAENDYLAGRYEEACAAFERFERKHPNDPRGPRVVYRIGMSLYRLGRHDEAVARLARIPEADLKQEAFRPALLALGDIHFQGGQWRQAEQRLADYLRDDPDAPGADDALLKLGLAHQRQGRYEPALRAYDTLLARFAESPHRLQALFERGQALAALNRFDEAREAFEQVLKEGGDSRFAPFAHNHLGALALRQERYQEAADRFARVVQAEVDEATTAEALYQLGQAWLLAERYEPAEESFARFLKQHAAHQRLPQARAQLAIAQARQDHFAEALRTMARVEREGFSKLDPALQTAVRYEKAWCLRKLGKSDEAASVYRTLLDMPGDKFNFHAALELAEIEASAKRYEPAAELLRRVRAEAASAVARVSPDVLEKAAYRLGVCEFELGRMKEAAALLEEFIEAFPESTLLASASFFCGEAYHQLGRHERAAQHFGRVVEKFASDPVYGPSLLRLGESLAALQRWAQSEKAFADYLDRFSDSEQWFQARFGIGWARENQGRHGEAIEAYRAVVARHKGPTAARAQFQIGECLFAQKQYDEAVRELLKVDILYAYPEWSAAALYEAGRCFEALGQAVEARAQFKAVVENHPQTRWAELAGQHLAKLTDGALPGRGGAP
jgi:TolA-binding protein